MSQMGIRSQLLSAHSGCGVQGAAMRLSVVELAAHNAVFSIWNACAYFPVPLQTTALAFVPACNTFQAWPPLPTSPFCA